MMEHALSEALATNVWKLFPFRSGNRVWFVILLKAYFCCILLGFSLACILNAVEGKKWLKNSIRGGWGVTAKGDTALDECFWFVFTTMHGIGFGEFMARGVAGRLIAMFCCTIGYWFTIFMMSIIMLSQLPGEKVPSLYRVTARMVSALWPSYSIFLALILAVGAVIGPYVSKDHEGLNEWPTGMYFTWTLVHRTPYGDIFPDTVFGRVVTVPIACMGVLYMPYALACIAVRCPSLEQHREIVGNLRSSPEDSLGRGYVQPPEAASNGSLQEFVMHDSYIREEDDDDDSGRGGRSCLVVCVLLTFVLIACTFFGGSPKKIQQQVVHTLELDLPAGIRNAADPVPPTVWTFWMHEYPLEGAGLDIFNSLSTVLDVDVELITPENLEEYNVTEEPFHKALMHLSPNHKLDYLRAYFMHHHGGGFLDIKKRKNNHTLTKAFDYIGDNESYWFLGQPSPEPAAACDESNIQDAWCKELQFKTEGITYADTRLGVSQWESSKGPCCKEVLQYYNNVGDTTSVEPPKSSDAVTPKSNGEKSKSSDATSVATPKSSAIPGWWPRHDAYIIRKETDFTYDLLKLVHEHLDAKLPVLKAHSPPAEPCCINQQENYPLRWEELRGEIWSPLLMKYKKHIKIDKDLV